MEMKNAVHPGRIIAEEVLAPLGLTVTEAARVLGVGRQALSAVLNGKSSLSADMAIRIQKAFGPDWKTLVRVQANYDIAQARDREAEIKVKRYEAKAA